MADLGKAYVQIVPSAQGIKGQMEKILGKELDNLGEKTGRNFGKQLTKGLGSVGKTLTKSLTVPIAGAMTAASGYLLKGGWDRIVGLDSARAQLEGLGYEMDAVERISNLVSDSIQGTVMTMADGVGIAAGALAAGVKEGAELERFIGLVGSAAVGSGREVNEMAMIFNRVQGMGKLMTMELNMIEDGMPGFSQAMAKHFGIGQAEFRDMVTAGEVSSQDFLDVMEDFAGGMSDAYSKSWQGIFSRVKSNLAILGEYMLEGMFPDAKEALAEFLATIREDDIRNWARGIGDTIGEAFRNIVQGIKDVVNWWGNLSDGAKQTIKTLGVIAVAMGPILTVISKLMPLALGFVSVLKAVSGALIAGKGAFAALKAGALAIMGPVGWVTAAIAGLVAVGIALWMNWDTVKEKAQQLGSFISKVWGNIKDWVSNGWNSAIESSEAFGNAVGKIRDAVGRLGSVFEPLKNLISNFGASATQVWENFKSNILGSSESIKDGFLGLGDSVSGLWEKITDSPALDYLATGIEYVVGRVISFKDAIVALVQDFNFEPILKEVSAFIPKLIGLFVSKQAGMMLAGGNLIKMIAEGMGLTVPELFEQVTNVLVGMIEQFAEALPQYVEMGTEMIIGFIDGLVAQIPLLTETAINIIMTLVDGLLGSIITIVEAGVTLLTSLVEGLVVALPQLIEAGLFIVLSLVGGILAMLPTIIETAISLVMALVEGLISVLPVLIETGITLLMALIEAFITMLPIVIETGITLLMALIEGIISVLPAIIEAAITLLMALIEGFISMLPVIIETGITLILALIEGLIAVAGPLIEAGITLLLALVDAFISMLPVIIEAGITIIMALIGGIIQVAPQLVKAGFTLITALGKALIQMIPTIISAGVQILGALVRGILSVLGQLIGAGMQLMGSLLQSILGFLGRMLSAGGQLISSLIRGITGAFSGAVTAVRNGVTSAWTAIKGFGNRFRSAGSSLITNFADGIRNAVGKVTGAVGNILQKARNLLPGSEPKDRTSPIYGLTKEGGWGENIASGILNGQSDVKRAMSDLLAIPSDLATDVLGDIDGNMNLVTASNIQHEVNPMNSRFEQLLEQLSNQQQVIVLDSGELVGATYPQYDRVGGSQTQLTERWGR